MTFSQWLKANTYDEAALSEAQKKHLEAAWKTETAPKKDESASVFEEQMAAMKREGERQQHIQQATLQACQRHLNNPDKIKDLEKLGQAAIADKGMTAQQFDLALMRADRMIGPMVIAPSTQQCDEQLLEAAVCLTQKLPDVDKRFSDQTLQAAHTRFRRGIRLKELLLIAAERNSGYRGSSSDEAALCRAAFASQIPGYYGGMRADVGPSTINVSGILSNVANKFLATQFLYAEQSWRQIAKIKTANDFKTMSTYRLTGSNKFEKVAPSGEIQHGTLSELPYTNKVDTYGKLLGINRQDIINDDLSAFTGAADELARGAGDSLNEVFWTEWLDDANFFNVDKSKANYDDGAVDSLLSLAGLENADAIFAAQTKPDGTPLGVSAAILLVPRGLRARAISLMSSQKVVGQGADAAPVPEDSPWAGMFKVVASLYLATLSGGSSTAWYLLADPMNVAAIEAAFLNGQETPTVETGQFNFDVLGLAMRAYMDFGVKKQEYRAGVKLKGIA